MGESKHDKIANNLAKQYGAEYNKGEGPDIKADNRIIEVATHESDIYSSLDQLKRFQKPRYIATTAGMVEKAKKVTEGTGIGVMGPTGIIKKKAK